VSSCRNLRTLVSWRMAAATTRAASRLATWWAPRARAAVHRVGRDAPQRTPLRALFANGISRMNGSLFYSGRPLSSAAKKYHALPQRLATRTHLRFAWRHRRGSGTRDATSLPPFAGEYCGMAAGGPHPGAAGGAGLVSRVKAQRPYTRLCLAFLPSAQRKVENGRRRTERWRRGVDKRHKSRWRASGAHKK